MYARPYLYLALAMLALGVLTGQALLISVGVLGVLTLMITWAWQRVALTGVTYSRRFSEDHAFWGETMDLYVALTNFKLVPLSWLESDELFPKQLPFVGGYTPQLINRPRDVLLGHTTAMRPFERITWRYQFACRARGLYLFGPVALRSGDPFGLFTDEQIRQVGARFYVYPKMLTLEELGLPPREPFGQVRARRQLIEDPLRQAGVREYRPEDPFKRIHWKATARTGELQVRVYDQTTNHTVMIFLNIETWVRVYEGVDTARAEWAIVVAASLARYATGLDWNVGLQSNAPATDAGDAVRVPPSRRPEQLTRMLEGLARMMIYPVREFSEILRTSSRNLPIGSTLVVITPVLPDPLRATLLRLSDRGLRLVVCALTDNKPEPLPGLRLYHLPAPRGADFLRLPSTSDMQPPQYSAARDRGSGIGDQVLGLRGSGTS